jgi:hypothetical protein
MSEPRKLDEIKNDILERVGRRAPFLHAEKAEAEDALGEITTLDGEQWAQAWLALGDRWEGRARNAESQRNSPGGLRSGRIQCLKILTTEVMKVTKKNSKFEIFRPS